LPTNTFPLAFELEIEPVLSPTRPPAATKLVVVLPIVPRANVSLMVPRLVPARPPRWVMPPSRLRPSAPVTLPVANDLLMVPWLWPTRPPADPPEPTLTLPVAQEKLAPIAQFAVNAFGVVVLVMVPLFEPTRPPASWNWSSDVALKVDATVPNACELVMVDPGAWLPTSPPAADCAPDHGHVAGGVGIGDRSGNGSALEHEEPVLTDEAAGPGRPAAADIAQGMGIRNRRTADVHAKRVHPRR
jgi:hypothetical protein